MMRARTVALAAAWTAACVLPLNAGEIVLDVPGSTLREVLTQVFEGRHVAVEWLDRDAAEQVVKGHYEGSIDQVAAGVLSRTDFTISHDGAGGIRRIVVKGRNPGQSEATAQTVQVQSRKLIVPVKLTADQRRQQVREKQLKIMQATNEALRQRIASLPPGWRPLRTQAIMTVPSFQRGNIPLITAAPPAQPLECVCLGSKRADEGLNDILHLLQIM